MSFEGASGFSRVTLYPPDLAPLAAATSSANSAQPACQPAQANGHSAFIGYANSQTPISVDSIGMGLVSSCTSCNTCFSIRPPSGFP